MIFSFSTISLGSSSRSCIQSTFCSVSISAQAFSSACCTSFSSDLVSTSFLAISFLISGLVVSSIGVLASCSSSTCCSTFSTTLFSSFNSLTFFSVILTSFSISWTFSTFSTTLGASSTLSLNFFNGLACLPTTLNSPTSPLMSFVRILAPIPVPALHCSLMYVGVSSTNCHSHSARATFKLNIRNINM